VNSQLGRLLISALGPLLVLLGFGLDALERFAEEPARPLFVLVLALGRYAMSGAYRFKIETQSEAKTQVLIPLSVITITIAALLGLPRLDRLGSLSALRLDSPALRWAGVALFAAGISFQAWSTITLGKWFSPRIAIQPEHELIQTGPYAYVRHPFYTGLLACLVGAPAVFGFWIGLPVAALAGGVVLYRVSVEERLLEAEFGEVFRAHRARTASLIPFVF